MYTKHLNWKKRKENKSLTIIRIDQFTAGTSNPNPFYTNVKHLEKIWVFSRLPFCQRRCITNSASSVGPLCNQINEPHIICHKSLFSSSLMLKISQIRRTTVSLHDRKAPEEGLYVAYADNGWWRISFCIGIYILFLCLL